MATQHKPSQRAGGHGPTLLTPRVVAACNTMWEQGSGSTHKLGALVTATTQPMGIIEFGGCLGEAVGSVPNDPRDSLRRTQNPRPAMQAWDEAQKRTHETR